MIIIQIISVYNNECIYECNVIYNKKIIIHGLRSRPVPYYNYYAFAECVTEYTKHYLQIAEV